MTHSPQYRVWHDMFKYKTTTLEKVKERTKNGFLTKEEYEEITGEKYSGD